MLVLSRKRDESIVIGNGVTVTVLAVSGNRVKLGINAPAEVPVHREEIFQRIGGCEASLRYAECASGLGTGGQLPSYSSRSA